MIDNLDVAAHGLHDHRQKVGAIMHLDLTDEETLALMMLLLRLSPRKRVAIEP
jgi:hypothetical protein